MSVLESLYNGKSIKQLNIKELNTLCDELRQEIVTTVSENGGHLSSNLGVVELTVALHYVFDKDVDKFIFDVGHQSYAHKILSGRFKEFNSLRQFGGISGFPDPSESECDAFISGHAGTSISAGLGYCVSRDYLAQDYFVIAVVGDASFFNGVNLEAITSSLTKPKKFLLVLNDNGMSIGKNNNGFYKLVSKFTIKKSYSKLNSFLSRTIGNTCIGKFLKRLKNSIKRSLSRNATYDSLGLKYVGKFDGHNLKTLIKILKDIKDLESPTMLHLSTLKGKGYEEAEKDSTKFHGVTKGISTANHYFSSSVSDILIKLKEKYPSIYAITAGMKEGVGLTAFEEKYPKSFIDVGIQEEYAVTLSAGMAISGTKPIVFIYSTFMQRAYDQILHDVCMQNLPVVFCVDRAGFVGSDGKTHQGLFDISYLSHIPNLKIFAPKDSLEFEKMLDYAISLNSPVAIRYPNGEGHEFDSTSTEICKFEVFGDIAKNVILAVGPRMLNLANTVKNSTDKGVCVVNARTVKPLDYEFLDKIFDKNVIVLEENVKTGGFGSSILNYYSDKNLNAKVKIFAVDDIFVSHATVKKQLELCNFSIENVLKELK